MIVRLSIENFALLERCDIEFAPGLNALTGQTGAGKSLLIDALGSILGERTPTDLIRHGCDSGAVEAFFAVEGDGLAKALGEILGTQVENGELVLKRRLSRSGRATAEANGRSIPLTTLRAAGELLVDIHGQNEHQRLLSNAVQLESLDLFAGIEATTRRFAEAYEELRERVKDMCTVEADRANLEREKEFLEHRVKEREAAKLGPDDELDKLVARKELVANQQQVTDTVGDLHRRLYDAEDSMAAAVERLIGRLSKLHGLSKDIDRWASLLEEAKVTLAETGREAGEFLRQYTWSPGELERVDDRIATLRTLCRRYGPTIADCKKTLASEKARLQSLGSIDIRLQDARKAAQAARTAALAVWRDLAKRRHDAAGKLAKKVKAELASLGMDQADFRIDFTTLTELASPEDVDKASPAGLESVEFMLMPNPGEGWAPLRKIASGGEIARGMLALKSVLAAADRTPVLVFDEIDSDIGGRLGEAIGRKLRSLASVHQVMVVTHLPQIAAFAQRQLRVEKTTEKGRTTASVHTLSREGRVAELAEMIRGPEKAKEAFDQAEKMLKSAESR